MKREGKDFCIECRHEVDYTMRTIRVHKTIRGKDYDFNISEAICKNCHNKISLPGLIDLNVKEIDSQYRAVEKIVTIEDIEKLMKLYNLGKSSLSLALNFGEITIKRYLAGQIPSKEYSDRIRHALHSTEYMESMLEANKRALTETAYKKAKNQIVNISNQFSKVSPKLLLVIHLLFVQLNEVTPLMLQKLLYYIQGIYLATYDRPFFSDDCEAWVHGPVYRNVYELFREFKYNPIDDIRFSLIEGYNEELTNNEKDVVLMVANTFGNYGGKFLEKITHKENPWLDARKDIPYEMSSNVIISKDSMMSYFKKIRKNYSFNDVVNLDMYIKDMMQN